MSNTPRDPLLSRLEIEGFADLLLVGVCISKQISRLYGVFRQALNEKAPGEPVLFQMPRKLKFRPPARQLLF